MTTVNRRRFLETSGFAAASLTPKLGLAATVATAANSRLSPNFRLKTSSSGAIYIHPWDITDEGINNCYHCLSNKCGLNEIYVAAIYHACTFLLPHNPKRMIKWNDGSAFFIPQHSHWRETRIKPVVSNCVDTPGYMHRIVDNAKKRNWGVGFFTVFHFNHSMAKTYPDACIVDVMGERHGAFLCPANPDVRGHDLAVVEELMDIYGGDAIRSEHLGYGGLHHWTITLNKIQTQPSPRDKFLLDLCFCTSCYQNASREGFHIQLFRRRVKAHLHRSLSKLPGEWDQGKVNEEWCRNVFEGQLWEYMEIRFDVVTRLFWEIQTIVNKYGAGLMPFGLNNQRNVMAQVDYSKFYPHLKRVSLDPQGETRAVQKVSLVEQVKRVPRWAEPEIAHEQHIYSSQQPLLKRVKMAREAGIRHHTFHYYGMTHREQREWIGLGREAWA